MALLEIDLKCIKDLKALIESEETYIVICHPKDSTKSRAIPQTFNENKAFKAALVNVCDTKIADYERLIEFGYGNNIRTIPDKTHKHHHKHTE